jgi:hypothetical protein
MSEPDLTPDELKRRYNEKTIREALTFKPQGVSEEEAKKYLNSPDGIKYLTRLNEAAPDASIDKLRERAIEQITSGRELPRMEMLDEPLVKIVPKGQQPSPSPLSGPRKPTSTQPSNSARTSRGTLPSPSPANRLNTTSTRSHPKRPQKSSSTRWRPPVSWTARSTNPAAQGSF